MVATSFIQRRMSGFAGLVEGLLGMWLAQSEGAKFWLSVPTGCATRLQQESSNLSATPCHPPSDLQAVRFRSDVS